MSREEDQEFQRVVMEGLVPQLAGSRVCISLIPKDEKNYIDAKFATELGAMILLNKPIIAIVDPGQEISPKLELVADKIVHADITTPEGQALLAEAIADFVKQFPIESEEDET